VEAFILNLLTDNPWIIWVALTLIAGLLILAVYHNREFGILGFKFGAKAEKSTPSSTSLSSLQSTPISIYTGLKELDDEQLDKIFQQVKERLESETPRRTHLHDLLKDYPQPPEEYFLVVSARHAVRQCYHELCQLVHGHKGGTFGHRHEWGVSVSMDYGYVIKDEKLLEELWIFEMQVDTILAYEQAHEEQVRSVLILAAYILQQLDETIHITAFNQSKNKVE
jgi:hypothetical protein